MNYHIQSNYHTMHSGFLKLLENLLENMYLIQAHFKERLRDDFVRGLLMMLMQYLFLIVFIKAYAVGTHFNCLDLSRQFK